MKLPKTFVPKKSLEEKTKQLLEEPKNRKDETKTILLYEELKAEFPNFTDYLFGLYSGIGIFKTKDKKGKAIWDFYTNHPKKTSPLFICKIESYTKECGVDVSEYGYRAKVLVDKKWHFLKYRIGHYCFDTANVIISPKYPLRHDKEENIPFP